MERQIQRGLPFTTVHRKYGTITTLSFHICQWARQRSRKNPGSLMPGVDITDPEQILRNPSLSNLLFDSGYIERYGFGIKMIEEEVSHHPMCLVEFTVSPASFTVIFRKKIPLHLDEMDNQILKLVHVPMKSGEISLRLNVSKNTILRRINKLEKMGLIEKKGSGT